jgi:hypothetical protein
LTRVPEVVPWLGLVETVVALVVLLLLSLGLLALRSRWLARQGGTFECSVRLRTTTPGAGWALGMARYNGEMLEWFRFFSYAFRPRASFHRSQTRVADNREPDAVEAVSLYAGQRIVTLAAGPAERPRDWELAMSPDSLTGLLSWLEAAPPGTQRAASWP